MCRPKPSGIRKPGVSSQRIAITPTQLVLSHPLCNECKIAIYFTNAQSRCSFPTCSPTVGYQAFPHHLLQHKHSNAVTFYGLLPSREDFTERRRAVGCKDFVLSSLCVSSLLLSTAAEHFPAEHGAMQLMSPICDSLSSPPWWAALSVPAWPESHQR